MMKVTKVVPTMIYQNHLLDQHKSTQYHQQLKPSSTIHIITNQCTSPSTLNEEKWSYHFIKKLPDDLLLVPHPSLQLVPIVMQRMKTSLQQLLMTWYGLENPYQTDSYVFIWFWITQQQDYPPHHRSQFMSQFIQNGTLLMTQAMIYLTLLTSLKKCSSGLSIMTLGLNYAQTLLRDTSYF